MMTRGYIDPRLAGFAVLTGGVLAGLCWTTFPTREKWLSFFLTFYYLLATGVILAQTWDNKKYLDELMTTVVVIFQDMGLVNEQLQAVRLQNLPPDTLARLRADVSRAARGTVHRGGAPAGTVVWFLYPALFLIGASFFLALFMLLLP